MISRILGQLAWGSTHFNTGSALANAPFDFLGGVLKPIAVQLFWWGS